MNQRHIGAIVIIIGVLLGVFVYMAKAREDWYINNIIMQTGSCFLSDGTCLHAQQSMGTFVFGGALAFGLVLLGIYLIVFDKTQRVLAMQHERVSSALLEAKKDERFNAFLSGFNADEQKVLGAIREQDGILQSTLRYRAGMSKAGLSIMLKSLEERGIVSRKVSGRTNAVYLRKTF